VIHDVVAQSLNAEVALDLAREGVRGRLDIPSDVLGAG
jgi:hypothetical protein